ncbi:hypothetical protein NL108_000940 [Boleophthalmus pectinirostris]|nr:hypothetical protein NL108_000940 [Boleophthalmus pectinirostris]
MTEEEEPSPVSSIGELSEFEKGQIVGAYLGGLSIKDVSEMCNVSLRTVSEILDVYKLYLELTPGLKRKTGKAVGMKMRKRLKEARNGQTEEKRRVNEEVDEGTDATKTGQPGSDTQEPTEDGQET